MRIGDQHGAKIELSLPKAVELAGIKKLLKKKSYKYVPFVVSKTHHLEIEAEINGIKGLFILDTGASNTCVGIDKSNHFDLEFEVSKVKAAGAGATEMETYISKKNSLRIGPWKNKKQEIVLFDLQHVNTALKEHDARTVDGIIGADVLKNSKAVIDYSKKRLYLKI